jgi:hypothetical protein
MTHLEQTTTRIERLFEELRDHLLAASQESAKSQQRDWAQAELFFAASKRVDELRRSILHPAMEADDARAARAAATEGVSSAQTGDRGSRRRSKKDYPKYAVRSNTLIKTGLSRDRRTEYEHAVPKPEFDTIVSRLGDLATRKRFGAEDVIEKVPSPSYQVYIVLSLFKERGLLNIPRRGMYAFARPKNFTTESQSIWDSLAQRANGAEI